MSRSSSASSAVSNVSSDSLSALLRESPSEASFARLERDAREALEDLAANGTDAAAHTSTLRLYREACRRRALYVEADLVQQVLRHARLDEEARHVRGLTAQQLREREALDAAHRDAFRRFHAAWNGRIDAMEEQQAAREEELIARQNDELRVFHAEVNALTPHAAHASRGLLDARAVEHILAEQRQYARAHRTKLEADKLAARDAERFMQSKVELLERKEAALRQRHQQERNVLDMKLERRRLELERARKRDLDVLLRRYINVRRELELQQNIIRSKTGAILLKHASNTKSDASGSAALVESAGSGAFGLTVQRRHLDDPVPYNEPKEEIQKEETEVM